MVSESAGPAEDEMKLIVRLEIHEHLCTTHTAPLEGSNDGEVGNFEAFITKGGSVAELKAVLESQDLLPPDCEQFDIEVKLSESSPSLQDSYCIPEATTHISMSVRPKANNTSSLGLAVPPPLSDPRGITSFLTPSIFPMQPARVADTSNNRNNAFHNNQSMASQMEAAQNMMADPDVMRQLLGSPFMRSMMSNPETIKAIIDANPRTRELRERNPELNHLLNDPQTMAAMQNPSLMREMMSNTDRALRNIDAVPGGFNALKRVYQSIQEPMWDAATGAAPGGDTFNISRKVYDLQRDRSPNTQPLPNPWATPQQSGRHPSRGTQERRLLTQNIRNGALRSPRDPVSGNIRQISSGSSLVLSARQPPIESPAYESANNEAAHASHLLPVHDSSNEERKDKEISEINSLHDTETVNHHEECQENKSSSGNEESSSSNPLTAHYPYLYKSVFPNNLGSLEMDHVQQNISSCTETPQDSQTEEDCNSNLEDPADKIQEPKDAK